MGLHSKVRYEILLKGKTRKEQEQEIIGFAAGYHHYLFDFIEHDELAWLGITQKLARTVSKSFTFIGYEDDEIFSILLKAADIKRKV